MNNLAFAKENTNETSEDIQNWSVTAPKIASRSTDKEKQTSKMITTASRSIDKENQQDYHQYQMPLDSKAKEQKQRRNKQKSLNSKYFLQG